MSDPADKLRKLIALSRDQSTTEGERDACLRAIERLKQSLPADVARHAEQKARETTEDDSFLRRARGRAQRRREGFQRYQNEQRERDFVRETVEGFGRTRQQQFSQAEMEELLRRAQEEFEKTWGKLRDTCQQAYPSAYGEKR